MQHALGLPQLLRQVPHEWSPKAHIRHHQYYQKTCKQNPPNIYFVLESIIDRLNQSLIQFVKC